MKGSLTRLLFTFSVLLSFALSAQVQMDVPAFHSFNKESGITHVSVADIAEDKYGFLWLASQSGIDKFDGYTFSNFGMRGEDETSGLQTLLALQIEASKDGQYMWIGTFSGLSRLNVDTEVFEHYNLPSSSSYTKHVINRIKTTRDGKLWIVSERNLYAYNEATDNIELVSFLPDTTSTLTDVELLGKTLYVASTEGLYRFDPSKKELELASPEKISITRLAAAEGSTLFLGTVSRGVCLFNPDRKNEEITTQNV